jgi:hypothetical protein
MEQLDYYKLATEYVTSQTFKMILSKWTTSSTSRNTIKETRQIVNQALKVGTLLLEDIVIHSIFNE